MRYSFHGKVRATGQQVDGFVEAPSSTEAIDRLADQGIIGVHTVRPEVRQPKNAVVIGPDLGDHDEQPKALPAPAQYQAPAPVVAHMPAPPVSAGTESVLAQLVEKLSTLTVQVEKLLSRPSQVIYQSGPARGGGGGGKSDKKSKNISDAQNSTLRDIFMTNMDLRRSLDKLTAPTAVAAGPTGPREVSDSPKGHTNGSSNGTHPRERILAQPAA